jgi:cytoskeleton protein RodZ
MTEAAAFAALASARQAVGLSLEEAARQLKFAPRQLEALEAGELQRLPGGTFVRGMVRSYARLLRVDPEPLLAQIAAQVPPPPDAERLAQRYSQPVPFSDGARRSNVLYVALSVVLLAAVAAVALQWRQERASTRTLAFVSAAQMPAEPAPDAQAGASASPVAAAPAASEKAAASARAAAAPAGKPAATPAPAGKAPVSGAPANAPAEPKPVASGPAPAARQVAVAPAPKRAESKSASPADGGTGRIALHFDGESWVEIRSGSGKLLVASLHSAGTERFVSGLPPFEVVIGNAQQVRLTYNDKPVDLSPYVKVEVARFTLP